METFSIKPIETKYKGYLFRSRAEARWAVFMDCLRIKWFYELEGYNMDGTLYLPDFVVPCMDDSGLVWTIEVKGPHNLGIEKAQRFDRICPSPSLGVIILDCNIEYPKCINRGEGFLDYNRTYYFLSRIGFELSEANYASICMAVDVARQYRF